MRRLKSMWTAAISIKRRKLSDYTSARGHLPSPDVWWRLSLCSRGTEYVSYEIADLAATTLWAAKGRRIPLSANSPTGSTTTAFSTFVSTRGLIKI